jgi:hypothetical protein
VTHKPAHARCPSLALRMTSLRRLTCPFNALPFAGDRLFMELRSRCTGSLVDCARRGKVSESRRADMARRAHFFPTPAAASHTHHAAACLWLVPRP